MAIKSSGTIYMSDINVERGLATTTPITLNDSANRTLSGVASGAISLGNFYGKSSVTEKRAQFTYTPGGRQAEGKFSVTDSLGNYYVVSSTGASATSGYITKFTPTLSVVWSVALVNSTQYTNFHGLVLGSDNFLYAVIYDGASGLGLAKISTADGSTVVRGSFGVTYSTNGRSLYYESSTDSIYCIVNNYISASGTHYKCLFKFNSSLGVLWKKTFNSPNSNNAIVGFNSLIYDQVAGNYVLSLTASDYISGYSYNRSYLIRFNSAGTILSQTRYAPVAVNDTSNIVPLGVSSNGSMWAKYTNSGQNYWSGLYNLNTSGDPISNLNISADPSDSLFLTNENILIKFGGTSALIDTINKTVVWCSNFTATNGADITQVSANSTSAALLTGRVGFTTGQTSATGFFVVSNMNNGPKGTAGLITATDSSLTIVQNALSNPNKLASSYIIYDTYVGSIGLSLNVGATTSTATTLTVTVVQ